MINIRTLSSILIFTGLAACGGGGGGDGGGSDPLQPPADNPPPVGGIGRTGIALGPVTTFGSVVVNGVRYDTSSASFTIDDSPGTEDDLEVGDVVLVTGTINDDGTTGTADSVLFDDAVTGPVESVDVTGNLLVVLGQNVRVRAETSFDDDFSPSSLEGIAVDQIVEVSGLIDANGDIVASRIEPKPGGSEFEVHGVVESLDTTAFSLDLGGLTVDYSGATLDDFPGGEISEGDFVEAKGTTIGAGGELVASSVEFESLIPDIDDGDRVEIEGFITRFASAEDFDVAGLPVTTTAGTEFEDGDVSDLGLNVKVEVEGDFNADGVLVAEEIEIERASAVRAEAVLDSVDAAAGTVVLLGITVTVDASTRIEDDSDADVDPLTLADVNAGDFVEVRGSESPAGSGNIRAALFERDDADDDGDETVLQGFVVSVSEPALEILGVTIQTEGGTEFRDVNDNPISAADFFDQVEAGSLVKAEGVETGDTTIVAVEVEFELEDDDF